MAMQELVDKIKQLEQKRIANLVDQRWNEFKKLGGKGNGEWFKELCFCILTANASAELGIRIQKKVGEGFIHMNQEELYNELRRLGHRFCRKRAEYIIAAQRYSSSIKDRVKSFDSGGAAREWLRSSISGLGMKESSHFLRNVGYDDVAIVDRHIIRLLVEHGLISRPNTITRNRYLRTERVIEEISEETGIPMGKLDLYMWYMKTGKVLK